MEILFSVDLSTVKKIAYFTLGFEGFLNVFCQSARKVPNICVSQRWSHESKISKKKFARKLFTFGDMAAWIKQSRYFYWSLMQGKWLNANYIIMKHYVEYFIPAANLHNVP